MIGPRMAKAFYLGGTALVAWTCIASCWYVIDPTFVILIAVVGFIVLSSASIGLTVDGLVPWRRALAFTLLCGALLFSVASTQWPLRVTFAFARGELNRLADELADGRVVPVPARAGIFTVREAEFRNEVVCLWIGGTPAGRQGFVRQAGTETRPRVNNWWYQPFGGDWFAVTED